MATLSGSLSVLAGQTSTTRGTAARPATRRTTTARTPSTACADVPVLGAAIPKIAGCPKPLYSLRFIDTVVGTGATVTARKWLTVNYTGYLVDGTKFDSSQGTGPDGKPKEPITFPYGARQVITGWDTGFEGMNIGGKRRLFIPYELAYGELGRAPTIPAKAQLIFDVELLGISDTPPAPKAPAAAPGGSTGEPRAPEGAKPAIPPTTAPPATRPAPATDSTKPTTIPPTTAPPANTAPPATTAKPQH